MDEYADIYYVDSARNASSDHRTVNGGSMVPAAMPRPAVTAQPIGAQRTVYVRPAQYAQPVYYAPPTQSSPVAALFGRLTTGDVVELLAQAFAALQSLPAAPIATKDAGTDVGNLILFQGALAQHAKRDEQLRTIGHLVAKLVG